MASIRDYDVWEEMDFDFRVGLIKNIDYHDYLEFLPFYIKNVSHELIDEDENGKFDYLDIVINATVKRTGNYDINFVLSSEYGYYYYYDSGSGYEEEESYSDSEDITDEVSDFEFGLIFGGGVKIPLQTGKLLIDIRYDLGLTNIIDDSQFAMTNKVWILSLGYEFSK